MEQKWYVTLPNNEQQGPFSDDEVRQMLATGRLHTGCYCWADGFQDWVPLSSVPEFAHAAGSVPPPPPAPSGPSDLEKMGQKFMDTFQRGKDRAKRKMSETKLKMKLSSLQKEREKLCAQFGAAVYQNRDEYTFDAVAQGSALAIAELDQQVAAVEQEIAAVQADG